MITNKEYNVKKKWIAMLGGATFHKNNRDIHKTKAEQIVVLYNKCQFLQKVNLCSGTFEACLRSARFLRKELNKLDSEDSPFLIALHNGAPSVSDDEHESNGVSRCPS